MDLVIAGGRRHLKGIFVNTEFYSKREWALLKQAAFIMVFSGGFRGWHPGHAPPPPSQPEK